MVAIEQRVAYLRHILDQVIELFKNSILTMHVNFIGYLQSYEGQQSI